MSKITLVASLAVFFLSHNLDNFLESHQIEIGPELYHVERVKDGGSKQGGVLYGIHLGYEHIKRYNIYLGVDGTYARGRLDGSVQKDKLNSILTDTNVEARLGYTFQSLCWLKPSLTPFLGYGYFWEDNDYKDSPLFKVRFHNCFSYIPFGFLSSLSLSKDVQIGLNVKVRFILNAENKVIDGSSYGDLKQKYDEKFQYRIECPLTQSLTCYLSNSQLSVIPFYEYRHYGYRVNFPFDFLETKFQMIGVEFRYNYIF